MQCGIYSITNIKNQKKYIGSSKNLKRRWITHKSSLRKEKHFNLYLQRAWNKYGKRIFIFEHIEYCAPNQLLAREEFWIEQFKSYEKEKGYNLCRKPRASRLGCKARPETIAKMRISLGGKNHPNWGRKLTKKHCRNMSRGQKGISKPNSGVKKSYIMIDPNGQKVEIFGLRKFCREHDITHTMLWRVAVGKQIEHRGWKKF